MAPFAYKPPPKSRILLRILDYAVEADSYKSVLDTLSEGVREALGRIDGYPDEEGVADYDIEVIENLLGMAYVACEVQIAAVIKAAKNFPNNKD